MTEKITHTFLNDRERYGHCTWGFSTSLEDAKTMPLDGTQTFGGVMEVCWAGMWGKGKRGFINYVENSKAKTFYMAVAVYTHDYLWYVQRYIDELCDLFMPHFNIMCIPNSVPVYRNEDAPASRTCKKYSYERVIKVRDRNYSYPTKYIEYIGELSHYDNRLILELPFNKQFSQQQPHAFLVYLRHVWEYLSRFPVQNDPPSLEDVWFYFIRDDGKDKMYWEGWGHSNFSESNYSTRDAKMTALDYVQAKREVIRTRFWPTKDNYQPITKRLYDYYTPAVKQLLLDAALQYFVKEKQEVVIPKISYNPWED